jgi:hypothetical protein
MESSYVSFRELAQDLKRENSIHELKLELKSNDDGIDNKEHRLFNNCSTTTDDQYHDATTTTTTTTTTEAMFGDVDESFVHDHDDDDDNNSITSSCRVEEEEPISNAPDVVSTPNVSMLNDSLLVDQGGEGGGGGEVLHEIPVTPVKGRRRPMHAFAHNNNHNHNHNHNTNVEDMVCLEIIPEEPEPAELRVGDHVYQWRSWMGIPGIFQHHGIVMDILEGDGDSSSSSNSNSSADGPQRRKLTIADFSNVPDAAKKKGRSGLTQEGILQLYTDTDKWHKVHYEASWWKRAVYRAGTCTPSKSDAVGLVLARVHFIVQHPDALPDYHVVHANCECVAFWCKTGKWGTLQASSFLEMTAAGQVKSTATLAGVVSSAQVSVPSTGLWGWMGYTSQVSYLSMHPIVLPALAGYAVVTVGVPAIMYANARKKWKETSQRLSDSFWGAALENPDVFAECITHWSEKR